MVTTKITKFVLDVGGMADKTSPKSRHEYTQWISIGMSVFALKNAAPPSTVAKFIASSVREEVADFLNRLVLQKGFMLTDSKPDGFGTFVQHWLAIDHAFTNVALPLVTLAKLETATASVPTCQMLVTALKGLKGFHSLCLNRRPSSTADGATRARWVLVDGPADLTTVSDWCKTLLGGLGGPKNAN